MSLTNIQYDAIMRLYQKKQGKNRQLLEERRNEVYQKIPDYQEMEEQISSLSVSMGLRLLEEEEVSLEELRSQISEIRQQKQQLLQKHGFPADYLSPVYDCPSCQDTGYVDGQKCHCFRQEEVRLLYEQSNLSHQLGEEDFRNLSYEYYTGPELEAFRKVVEASHNFIQNFTSDYQNLLFYGTVGTGKSFLSGCIAKELIEKGHSVIYFSAVGLFQVLSQSSFDYKNKEELQGICHNLYDCDLLIIDDLGTELVNSFVASQLFSQLNERHLRRKSTIISTNLSLAELRDRYSDRILSRLSSNYNLYKLTGPDIRIYKKKVKNRK